MVNSSIQFLNEDEKSTQADMSSLQLNQTSCVDSVIKKSKIYDREHSSWKEDSLRTPKVLNQVSLAPHSHSPSLILHLQLIQ